MSNSNSPLLDQVKKNFISLLLEAVFLSLALTVFLVATKGNPSSLAMSLFVVISIIFVAFIEGEILPRKFSNSTYIIDSRFVLMILFLAIIAVVVSGFDSTASLAAALTFQSIRELFKKRSDSGSSGNEEE